MASDRGSRSVSEASFRKQIANLTKQGLRLGLGATQSKAAKPSFIEADFATNEPMTPTRINLEGVAKEGDRAVLACPA